MGKGNKQRYLLYTFLLLLLIMFLLPFYSADTYSIVKNTTSVIWGHKVHLTPGL